MTKKTKRNPLGGGRPPISGEKRTKWIRVRVTDEELNKVGMAANGKGYSSVSMLVRVALVKIGVVISPR